MADEFMVGTTFKNGLTSRSVASERPTVSAERERHPTTFSFAEALRGTTKTVLQSDGATDIPRRVPDAVWLSKLASHGVFAIDASRASALTPGLGETPYLPLQTEAPETAVPPETPDVPLPGEASNEPGLVQPSDVPVPVGTPEKPTPIQPPDVPLPGGTPDEPTPVQVPDVPLPGVTPDGPTPVQPPDIPRPGEAPDEPTPVQPPDIARPSGTPDEPTPVQTPDVPLPEGSPDEPTWAQTPDVPTSVENRDQVGPGEWQKMLDGNLTAGMLTSVADPAALLNALLESIRHPYNAVIYSEIDGGPQPLNASWLSSRKQAEAILAKLLTLGIEGADIVEAQITGGPFSTSPGDERRAYLVSGMNVGMLLERYARYPVEVADRMTLDELDSTEG